jgi:hypothetical protein
MLRDHPSARPPEDRDASLWRFMDFTKYVAMLDARAIYFSRADRFSDPFEGTYARPNRLPARATPQQGVYVNCWHRNPHESAAMWRIYLKSDEGVALEASYARLVDAFEEADETLHIGQVRYLDYERQRVPEKHDLDPFLCKRKSFDFEREVRVLWRAGDDAGEGRYIGVDLERLLGRVVVSPAAEPWFTELVRSVTTRYGVEIPVEESELARDPDDEPRSDRRGSRAAGGSGSRGPGPGPRDRALRPRARHGSRRAGSSVARRSP